MQLVAAILLIVGGVAAIALALTVDLSYLIYAMFLLGAALGILVFGEERDL